jgi:hypothetical protein
MSQGLLHKLTVDKVLRAEVSFVMSALGHFITQRYLVLEQIHAFMGETVPPRKLEIIRLRSKETSEGMGNGCEHNK